MKKSFKPKHAALLLILALSSLLMYRDFAGLYNEERDIPQDFLVYHDAGQKALTGRNPYYAETFLVYKYSPGILPLLMALPDSAGLSWNLFKLISTLLLAVVLYLIGSGYRTWRDFGLLCLSILLTYRGMIDVLAIGQAEFFLLASTAFAVLLCRRYPALSGFLISWLIAIKLPWGFFAVPLYLYAYTLDQRTHRTHVWGVWKGLAAGTLFWFALFPLAVFGWETTLYYTKEWLAVLRDQPSDKMYNPGWNQGLYVFFSTKLGFLSESFKFATSIILSALLAGWMIYRAYLRSHSRQSEGPIAWFTPWYIVGLLINPLAWRWGSAVLVAFPFALAGHTLVRNPTARKILWILLAASFILQRSWAELFFTHFDPLANGMVTLYWLLMFLLIV